MSNGNAQIPGWRKVQFLAGQGALLSTTAEVFEIVQQHPERDGEYQYKIKSLEERI